MTTREYRLDTPHRTGVLQVTEFHDRVELVLSFSRRGDFGDEAAIACWLYPLLAPYDRDARPIVLTSPGTGHRAVVDFDGSGRPVAVVTTEPLQ